MPAGHPSSPQTPSVLASVVLTVALAAGGLTACGGGRGADTPVGPPPVAVARVAITTPRPVSVAAAGSVALAAEARSGAGAPVAGAAVAWQSLDAGVATVSAGGLVQAGTAGGTARIVAAAGGAADTLPVLVLPPVARVVVTTARPAEVAPGGTLALAAEARAADGGLVAVPVTWAALDAGVATVSGAGIVTAGAAPGTARVVASAPTTAAAGAPLAADTLTVTVAAPRATSLGLVDTLLFAAIAPGEAGQLAATPLDAGGQPTARPVTWTSSAPAVATVAADGTVRGVAPGVATITATVDGQAAQRALRVTTRPFRIELVYSDNGDFTAAARAVARAAADRWQRIVAEGSASGAAGGTLCTAGYTGPDPATYASTGRLRVRLQYAALPAGQAGAQGTECLRPDGQALAISITLDTTYRRRVEAGGTEAAQVVAITAHELGHGLGIGSWRYQGTNHYSLAANTYTGPQGVSAWQGLGGAGEVPLQPEGANRVGAHWSRGSGLCLDLMAPSVGPQNRISRVTVGALVDLGWQVDLARAESLPWTVCAP